MQGVLLILFSYSGIENITNYLSEILDKDNLLYVEGVVIEEISPSFSSLISDLGFLGDKVVNDVQDAVAGIYRENAVKQLNYIEKEFSKKGINVISEKIFDNNLERIDSLLAGRKIDEIIINYTENEYIMCSNIDKKIKKLLAFNDIFVKIYYDGYKN